MRRQSDAAPRMRPPARIPLALETNTAAKAPPKAAGMAKRAVAGR